MLMLTREMGTEMRLHVQSWGKEGKCLLQLGWELLEKHVHANKVRNASDKASLGARAMSDTVLC